MTAGKEEGGELVIHQAHVPSLFLVLYRHIGKELRIIGIWFWFTHSFIYLVGVQVLYLVLVVGWSFPPSCLVLFVLCGIYKCCRWGFINLKPSSARAFCFIYLVGVALTSHCHSCHVKVFFNENPVTKNPFVCPLFQTNLVMLCKLPRIRWNRPC
jgi:hypothetical protein